VIKFKTKQNAFVAFGM